MIGSVYASLYASRLASVLPAGVPGAVARTAHGSVGAALSAAGKLAAGGHPALGAALHNAASSAFFDGFHAANYVAAGVAGVGAVTALALLPSHPGARPSGEDATDAQATASPAALAAGGGPHLRTTGGTAR